MLTEQVDMFLPYFSSLSIIVRHDYGPDDIIENGRQDLTKSHGTSSVNLSTWFNWILGFGRCGNCYSFGK